MKDYLSRLKRNLIYILCTLLITAFTAACADFASIIGHWSFCESSNASEDSSFIVYFLNVGQADSAVVLCDGEAMLIDGGNQEDSSFEYSFLEQHGIEKLKYVVCSHPHEDHVGGLSGALNYAKVNAAFSPTRTYDSRAFDNFVKYLDGQGVEVTVPLPGDLFRLGSALVYVLGPIHSSNETNNTSIVLRIVYGNTSFLFTGDAEKEEEQDILNAGYELESTVLKVGHHGSDTSTSYPFLQEVSPQYGIISVGTDNAYGHPSESTLSKLSDADVTVYRTDLHGTITCVSDGNTVSFTTEKNAVVGSLDDSEVSFVTDFVLNNRSMKFHFASCESIASISPNNIQYYAGSRDELIKQGYTPCGACKP